MTLVKLGDLVALLPFGSLSPRLGTNLLPNAVSRNRRSKASIPFTMLRVVLAGFASSVMHVGGLPSTIAPGIRPNQTTIYIHMSHIPMLHSVRAILGAHPCTTTTVFSEVITVCVPIAGITRRCMLPT